MTDTWWKSSKLALCLALAGLGSALLGSLSELIIERFASTGISQGSFLFTQPLIFGAVLGVYFLRRDRGEIWRVFVFIAAAIAAYWAAISAGARIEEVFPRSSEPFSFYPVPLGAGFVGALVILGSALFLFGTGNLGWRWLLKVPLWATAGGLLATAGWEDAQLLPLIWQTGIGFCLGLMISDEEAIRTETSESLLRRFIVRFQRDRLSLVTILFFCGLFAILGWQIFRKTLAEQTAARETEAYKQGIQEVPPVQNLPRIRAVASGQALIVDNFDELSAEHPLMQAYGGFTVSQGNGLPIPPRTTYTVSYVQAKRPSSPPRVTAEVTEYPNSEWARYWAKYSDAAPSYARSPATVTKLGNRIVMSISDPDIPFAPLWFVWPSGNFVVTVKYETDGVNEKYLERYLLKYPSSL